MNERPGLLERKCSFCSGKDSVKGISDVIETIYFQKFSFGSWTTKNRWILVMYRNAHFGQCPSTFEMYPIRGLWIIPSFRSRKRWKCSLSPFSFFVDKYGYLESFLLQVPQAQRFGATMLNCPLSTFRDLFTNLITWQLHAFWGMKSRIRSD